MLRFKKIRVFGRYDEAVQCYEEALGLCPHNASTHAALGFTFQLQGRLDEVSEPETQCVNGRRPD